MFYENWKNKYDIAIFDCDGVILDSNKIKTEAFRKVVEEYDSKRVEQLIDYHLKSGGVSRFEKIKYFFTEILNKNDQALINEKINLYGEIVINDLKNSKMVEGVEDFLKYLNENGTTCFVNSGGKESELHAVFKYKNLDKYFDGIYGSPKTKKENMLVIKDRGFQFDNSLFLGDSKSDYITAKEFNCDFVYVRKYSEWSAGVKTCINELIIKTFND